MNFTRPIKQVTHKKLWCDDNSPSNIDEFIGNTDICKNLYISSLCTSMLLVGPHGCGKTTFARLIVRKMLGENYNNNLLELYSSINRNKNYIGNKLLIDNKNINDFINVSNGGSKLKVIIVYDVDTSTYDSQQIFCELLREKNVIIIFTCNSIQGLSDNLLSSVMTINMSSLKYDEINSCLESIAYKKNMKIMDSVKKAICISCNGDLKKLFNIMQLLSGVCEDRDTEINIDVFYKLIDMPSYECIKELLKYCEQQNTKKAFEKLNEIIDNGYDNLDILDIIEKTLLYIDIIDSSFDIEKQNNMLTVVTQCIVFKKYTKIQLFNMVYKMCYPIV